jgi:uncharacterized membrane protein YgcG
MLFAAFCLVMFAPTAPAAQTDSVKDCDQQILDLTAGKVLHEDPAIRDAMNELQSQGVDVRVRAFDAAPSGSLDAYQAGQTTNCPSWGRDGQIKPNLVVVLDSLDHQDAIFYGKNFSEKMQPEVDAIRVAMQSPNQEGKFSTAVATALHDSSEVIKGNQNPATESDGLPVWAWVLIIAAIIIVIFLLCLAFSGRGGRGGGGGGGFFFASGDGGSSSSGGGFSCGGGSSGSW